MLVYNANQLHHGAMRPPGNGPESNYLCGLDRFKPEWRATMDNGTTIGRKEYIHNLSNPRKYVCQHYSRITCNL